MKTLNVKNVYESAKASAKNNKALAAAVKDINKKLYSLNALLKELRLSTDLKPYAETLWAELGIQIKSKGHLIDSLCPEQFAPKSKKDATPMPALIVRKLITKEVTVEGQTVHIADLDSAGQKQYRYEKSIIKDGAWSVNVLRDLLLQRKAILEAQA